MCRICVNMSYPNLDYIHVLCILYIYIYIYIKYMCQLLACCLASGVDLAMPLQSEITKGIPCDCCQHSHGFNVAFAPHSTSSSLVPVLLETF